MGVKRALKNCNLDVKKVVTKDFADKLTGQPSEKL